MLFVVAILAEVGTLPEIMKALVLGLLVVNFLFSYRKTLRAKIISR